MNTTATHEESPPPTVPGWVGPTAGVIGAGAAMAFGELVSGFTSSVPSLVIAMAEVFVDKTPGGVVESGIQAVGTNDKPLLIAGVAIATLAIGGVVGRKAMRRARVGDVSFAALGLIGAWAAQRNPFASTAGSIITAAIAAVIGALTLRSLVALARALPWPSGSRPPAGRAMARRTFVGLSGAGALAALAAAVTGRSLRNGRTVEAVRDAITLPPTTPTASGATASGAASGAAAAAPTGVLDGAVSGISTYLTPNKNFYRIDNALTVPQVDPAKWKLKINGFVDHPYELTYDEILAMPQVEETVTLSCVSNEVGDEYVGNARWRGVPLHTILERAGVQAKGTQIAGISVDDFDASFPTELAFDGRTALLAIGMNDEPLPVLHGFPARLVVAGVYGYVSAVKWLAEIRLVDDDYDAYWIPRGWSKLGPIKTQSRIDVPRTSKIAAGNTAIGGVAWAPTRGIAAVEVQIDDGAWQPCQLGTTTSDETWVQWMLPWHATPGTYSIRVRATDKTGYTQSAKSVSPRPNGAEGQHRIKVTVV